MRKVAVATTSQLAADAAAEIADAGGNAVDCAIAAALLTMNTEPGVCALAGSAFITIWAEDGDPLTIDGNVAVPGAGRQNVDVNDGVQSLWMDYGGGVETLIGAATIAVPGSLAALELASKQFGASSWRSLVAPSIRAAGRGFPLSSACHHYLQYSGKAIFSRSEDGFDALHNSDGTLKNPGCNIVVPHLADSLQAIADEGAQIFYRGDIARKIVQHVADRNGLLSRADLEAYTPIIRPALCTDLADWRIATNPPPAVGGTVLSAMLLAFRDCNFSQWSEAALQHLIDVQHATLNYRAAKLDTSADIENATRALLAVAADGQLISRYASASTVHTSAVDNDGLACSITASSGYGSGEMPAQTGIWLNNCVGELELNSKGLDAGPVGARLPSNMAPTVARSREQTLAVGSPGADRITTAIHQFLIGFLQMNMSLQQAVQHPRLHFEIRATPPRIVCEPGMKFAATPFDVHPFDKLGMYFGGIGAVNYSTRDGFSVAADPRREGATFVSR